MAPATSVSTKQRPLCLGDRKFTLPRPRPNCHLPSPSRQHPWDLPGTVQVLDG